MTQKELIDILHVAERLKCSTRHCFTSSGRRESVAEHSWRIALMAMLLKNAFPEADMDRVIRMCLIHDLGEAFTGDIPTFEKTQADEQREDEMYNAWVQTLPEGTRVTYLTTFFNRQPWAYVETTVGGTVVRGFIPASALDVASPSKDDFGI